MLIAMRRGNADRSGTADKLVFFLEAESFLGNRRADTLGDPESAISRGFGKYHAKFFAANARTRVGLAQARHDNFRNAD